MRALVTGSHGTVGQALSARLCADGHDVTAWDRQRAAVDDEVAARQLLESVRPDVIFHLAIASQPTGVENEGWCVNVEWPELLARLTAAAGIRLVFTSTAMVFSDDARGPFTVAAKPDAHEGYGYEKRIAEQRVRAVNAGAVIARLGWQIGDASGSNNMIDFLERNQREHGCVRASTKWLPACSFLPDTADVLMRLAQAPARTYHIDANERWTFHEIALALSELHGRQWQVEPTDDFVYDQRLVDEHICTRSLATRLSLPD